MQLVRLNYFEDIIVTMVGPLQNADQAIFKHSFRSHRWYADTVAIVYTMCCVSRITK